MRFNHLNYAFCVVFSHAQSCLAGRGRAGGGGGGKWSLLKGSRAFDLAVGVGKEVIDLRVERVLFKDRDGMPGVGNDPKIRYGDVCCDQDGMLDGDDVVVAADDEGRAADLVELVEGDMRLIEVKVEDFLSIFIFGGFWSFEKVIVTILHEVIDEGGEAGGIGPEVGAGKGHLPDLIGVADSEEDRVDTAVAPADDVATVEVQGIAEGVEVVDDHFEAQGVAGIGGFAVGAGVDSDDVVVGGEVGNLVAHIGDRAPVAVEKQERFALAVRFVVQADAPGV